MEIDLTRATGCSLGVSEGTGGNFRAFYKGELEGVDWLR